MTSEARLPDRAQVVVIGGGAMGCSTLYHLAKQGVADAVLLERNQLTSGTTWHSAAQVRQLRSTRNMTRLSQYSAELYAALEAETGQHTGWTKTGSLSIATSPDRLTHIRRQAALARAYGVAVEEVSTAEVKRLWPLANSEDVIGAVFSPDDGRVNPSDFCLALVKGARARGARVFEETAVTGFLKDGSGRIAGVQTAVGDIRAEAVVICGGLWSRALAAKAGVEAPLLPCEHYYLLTKPIEGIEGHLPTLSDHDSHLYLRDDVGGLLVGCFEPQAKALDPSALGDNFAFSLLNGDWDHFEPIMINALHRIPALETAEVRTLLNGPESFTPDGAFLLGESAEVPGLFLGCGMNSVGIATGGGAGMALAHWVVEGAAPFHLGEVDPRRFHAAENALAALMARAPEVLGKHYEIAFPGRQFESARDLRRGPLHDRWTAAGARFGQVYGWERPHYFGAAGAPEPTFGRPGWHEQVGREVRAAHAAAAVFDLSTFGKIRVTGPDAAAFLDRVCANDMTRAPGRAIYTALLNPRGGYESDLTALRLGESDYRLMVGTGAVKRDLAWLARQRRPDEDVTLQDETEAFAVLGLMGQRAAVIGDALGGGEALAGLGYFRHAEVTLAGIACRAARLSYVGEAGWEIACAVADATALYDAMAAAGAAPAGLFAQTAMRIEKRFAAMGHELDGDVTPVAAGLDFAVKKAGDFIGRAAVERARAEGPESRLVTLLLDDGAAVPLGDEPVYCGERLVGQATSAAYGFRIGRPLALAYVAADIGDGEAVALDIAGTRFGARLTLRPAFDPDGTRMRYTAGTASQN